jgi:hypothetical protein
MEKKKIEEKKGKRESYQKLQEELKKCDIFKKREEEKKKKLILDLEKNEKKRKEKSDKANEYNVLFVKKSEEKMNNMNLKGMQRHKLIESQKEVK